jgi:hypothetical protein
VVSFVKSVTFDCADPLRLAEFWAAAVGSDVDEDSTSERAWVEPAGWGGPSLWFQGVPEAKSAKNRQHFDLRAVGDVEAEVRRLVDLGASERSRHGALVVMQDPEGNEFCVES